MLSSINSIGLIGINTYNVEVQVDLSKGLPAFDIVGLAGTSVKESRERVRAAIKNSGDVAFPAMRITCNLAPADIKKDSTVYDLPISIGILQAMKEINNANLSEYVFIGELSLDGKINKVNGVLPMIIGAKQLGYKKIVLPKANENEARFIDGIEIYACNYLMEIVKLLNGEIDLKPTKTIDFNILKANEKYSDIKDIKGQMSGKRALEIAAAGNHNVLFIGPAGSGKTMLARCMPSILPDMNFNEALQVTKIHSISGNLDTDGIIFERPFRSPHHGVSSVALIGGGSSAKPGEISLAHNGVLFLDEFPEFSRKTIESLRQPLEDGFVSIARINATCKYPSRFMLVVSMNPCPCGNFGSDKECRCSSHQIQTYLNKVSGPMLDRFDLHIEMSGIKYTDIKDTSNNECSKDVRKRVNLARKTQYERNGQNISNAMLNNKQIKEIIKIDEETESILENAFVRLKLSARSYYRILKVARTIADLANEKNIDKTHIMEALQYRGIENKYWQ